jgi:hypothetical protein
MLMPASKNQAAVCSDGNHNLVRNQIAATEAGTFAAR